MVDWKKLIEDNEDKIKEACLEADKEAYENRHMQFTLYLRADGELYTFGDIAGGNSEPVAAWNGEEFAIHTFCYQYYSALAEVSNETIACYLPDGRDYLAEYKEHLAEEYEEDESGKFAEWLKNNYEEELTSADMEIFSEEISQADYSPYVEQAIESAEW